MRNAASFCIAIAAAAFAPAAFAKLPPLTDEAKAKAAETTARAAWTEKIAMYQLCQSMDRVAAAYRSKAGAAGPAMAPPTMTATTAPAATPSATPAATPSATPAATTAAPVVLPPCADPGPFAYTPPASKPLEAAGAHSPPGTAASPPSQNPTSAEMTGKTRNESKP